MKGVLNWLELAFGRARSESVALAYRDLFESESGKIVMNDLGKFCHVVQGISVNPDGTPVDSEREAWMNEGKRLTYLHIVAVLQLDASDFPVISQEITEQ